MKATGLGCAPKRSPRAAGPGPKSRGSETAQSEVPVGRSRRLIPSHLAGPGWDRLRLLEVIEERLLRTAAELAHLSRSRDS